jgi:putative transposase
MATSFANLLVHVVFSTKHRVPSIEKDRRDSLQGYIGGVARQEGAILLEAGGMPDHIHLLIKLHADLSVARLVRLIKSNSSRWLNQQSGRTGRFEWQTGYGAFSVSESRINGLRSYIRRQEEHHARMSFPEELVLLLRRHHIEYDERYLLG